MAGPRLAGQRVMSRVAAELRAGRTSWFTALGTSMTPTVRAVQRVHLRPVRPGEPLRGQVVLARVHGRWWLHRATDETTTAVLIAGDNGHVNGWTPRDEVCGVLAATRRTGRRRSS